MERWVEIALEEGVRFFVTSLGKPRWVVERVEAVGGTVYHDVTERKWALKARDSGVHGLIAVNRRAGGHAGPLGARELLEQLGDLGLPVVCAGGIATPAEVMEVLEMGYAGVQMGTRFIATPECRASEAYKGAIVRSDEDDIVLSERITGVPVAVIATPWIRRMGLRAGPLARWMLRGSRTKHWMRAFYTLRAAVQLKRASLSEEGGREFWQAGKSVGGIHSVEPVHEILGAIGEALQRQGPGGDLASGPMPT
jgi:nitronate monooxygenase